MKQSQNQEMQNESSPRVTRNQPSVTFGMESTTEFALVFLFYFCFLKFHFSDLAQNNLINVIRHLCSNGGKVRNASVEYVK